MKNTKKLLCALALSLPICTFAMDENRSKSRSRAFTFQQEVAPVAEKSSLQKCKETFSTLEKHDKLLLVTSMSRSMSPKSLIAAAQILLQSAATQSKALTADSNLALLHTQQAITNMLLGNARQALTETPEIKKNVEVTELKKPTITSLNSAQNTPKKPKKNKSKRQSLVSNSSTVSNSSEVEALDTTPDKSPRTIIQESINKLKNNTDSVPRESLYIDAVSPANKRESTSSVTSVYTSYRNIKKPGDIKSRSADNSPRLSTVSN